MRPRYSRVLVAEDEAIIMLGFKTFLTQLGYEVVGEAYDGEAAVSLAETTSPDFLIMDVKMPGLDGIQALEKINTGRAHAIPCVFVTAHSDEYLVSRARDAGAFSYLIKPITMESLRAAIDIALRRYADYADVLEELGEAKGALETRKIIERAKGFLMDNFQMKEKQAMEYMQKKSRDTNRKLVVVARSILQMDEALKDE